MKTSCTRRLGQVKTGRKEGNMQIELLNIFQQLRIPLLMVMWMRSMASTANATPFFYIEHVTDCLHLSINIDEELVPHDSARQPEA